MPGRRKLITNGHVLSMDPAIGEIEDGAVLIEDDRIVAVERGLADVDAEVIDADGGVIMPGFVDTHRHTWQTSLRAICADWTLFDYTIGMRMTLSPRCTAEDVYVGNHVGALEALDAGVTTILDFSHCNNTPEHADRALQGLHDAGIRALFAYGYFAPPAADPHFTSHAMRLEDSRRVHADLAAHGSDLVTMGISLTRAGPDPVRRHAQRGRDRARARRAHGDPHRLRLEPADGPRPVRRARPARPRHRPRALQHLLGARVGAAARLGREDLDEPGDRDPDGHGPPADPPRARPRDSRSASAATSCPATPATCSARCGWACSSRAAWTTTC